MCYLLWPLFQSFNSYPQRQPLLGIQQLVDGEIRSSGLDDGVDVLGGQGVGDVDREQEQDDFAEEFEEDSKEHLPRVRLGLFNAAILLLTMNKAGSSREMHVKRALTSPNQRGAFDRPSQSQDGNCGES